MSGHGHGHGHGRIDVAFTSYGTTGWLPDLDAWAQGVARVLRPGGGLVSMKFHPLRWSFDDVLGLTKDDYFETRPFTEPVPDYVLEAGAALGVVAAGEIVSGFPSRESGVDIHDG